MIPRTRSTCRVTVAAASWASNMPNHTLEEIAINILQQRGAQPTPANVQAIKNALEQNPELLDNVQGSFRMQQQPREGDRQDSTNPIVFRDQFDTALDTAVNGGVAQATPGAVGPQGAPPAPPVDINVGNQAAPPIEGVEVQQLEQIVAALPPEIQNGILDAITGGSTGGGGGGGPLPAPGDEGSDFPFIPVVGPAGKGTDIAVREGAGLPAVGPRGRGVTGPGQIEGGVNPAQIEGPRTQLEAPRGAIEGPLTQIEGPQAQRALPPPSITDDVSAAVDTADAKGAKIKSTTLGGQPAATFRVGKDQIVTTDGERFAVKSNTGADLVEVRSESLLERIRAFIQANAQEFRAVLRVLR